MSWLILWLLPRAEREFIAGDLEERLGRWIEAGSNPVRARLRYWRDLMASIVAVAAARVGAGRGRRDASRHAGAGAGDPGGGRGGPFGGLAADFRFGMRSLRRRPAYALLAICTLAIGIGATTSVFSAADAILLRPLPGLSQPDRLVLVEFVAEEGWDQKRGVSLPDLEALNGAAGFAGLAGNAQVQLQVRPGAGDAFAARGEAVAGDYFGILGARPLLGRLLTADESRPGSDPSLAVISEAFWTQAFGRDPDVIGRTLRANRQTFTIVGVVAGGFAGTEFRTAIDVWVPVSAYGPLRHFGSFDLNRPGLSFFQQLIGRLADGVTLEAAQAELRGIFAGLVEERPDLYEPYTRYLATVFPGLGIEPIARTRTRNSIGIMFGVVGLVLLIACANVANLLLFRGVQRRGEMAVRRALGASGARVARQSLIESSLIGLGGAAAGLLVARATGALFAGVGLLRLPAFDAFRLDRRVLLFAVLAAVATSVLFGAAPALAAARSGPAGALRETGGPGRRSRLRTGLSALQLALSLALLVCAILLLRTVRDLYRVDTGFDAAAVTAFMIDPELQGYDDAEALALYDRVLDGVRAVPGVDAAAISTHPPLVGSSAGGRVRTGADTEWLTVDVNFVSPGLFETLGTNVLRGRAFEPGDAHGTAVLVDESLARRLFPGANAVGRTIDGGFLGGSHEIVGVVPDLSHGIPTTTPQPTLYEPLPSSYTMTGFILARGRLSSPELEAAVREVMRDVDPAIPLTNVRRLSDGFDDLLAEQRLFAKLLGCFAVVALLLSAIGLYALVSHSVASRTREIGVRVALGAWRTGIARLVLGEALHVAAVGIAFGLAGAWAVGRPIEHLLFGVTPQDPLTWAVAAAVFTTVTLAAALTPALAALRVDPVEALRSE